MQPISDNGKGKNELFSYQTESGNSVSDSKVSGAEINSDDASLFKKQHNAEDIRFPGSMANSSAIKPADTSGADISSMYGLAEYPSLKSNTQSESFSRLPGLLAGDVAPQSIPSLAQAPRAVLPGSMMNDAFSANQAGVSVNTDQANAQTQVWSQSIDPNARMINVDYLTSTPKQLEMPVQQLKNEWEQGDFDTLNTMNPDALQGESVYLPWHQGERTAPGDWKVFANHIISKYSPDQSDDRTKIGADLDNPFSYNFDTQKASVGAVEEKLHTKHFGFDDAEQAWGNSMWSDRTLSKPGNHHSEEVVQLPWSEEKDSVHILTWWRFLNELGGYQNP